MVRGLLNLVKSANKNYQKGKELIEEALQDGGQETKSSNIHNSSIHNSKQVKVIIVHYSPE